MIILENKSYMCVSVVAEVLFIESCKVISVNLDFTAGEIIKSADKVQQGGFSATAFSEDKNQTCIRKCQRYVFQSMAFVSFFLICTPG